MNHLNELMIERGMSQKEIALIVGVSRPTVSDWVNNKKDPRGQNLQKLAAYLNVDWREIVEPKKGTTVWSTQEADSKPVAGLTEEDVARVAAYIQQQQQPKEEEADVPRTVEARIVSFGMDNLPKENRERLLDMIRAMYSKTPYEKYFIDEDGRAHER